MNEPRIIVLTAPSGSGKTTIARRLMDAQPSLRFSISATTRPARPNERHGIDYYFMTTDQFEAEIENDAFVEYEEVYPGCLYGTLRSEIDSATSDSPMLLDIDVNGARRVKELVGDDALAIFIRPPSVDALRKRLLRRATESDASLKQRLERAEMEMSFADEFDTVVINDDLETATAETLDLVHRFLSVPRNA